MQNSVCVRFRLGGPLTIYLEPAVDRQPAHRRGDRRAASKKTLKNIAKSCQKRPKIILKEN